MVSFYELDSPPAGRLFLKAIHKLCMVLNGWMVFINCAGQEWCWTPLFRRMPETPFRRLYFVPNAVVSLVEPNGREAPKQALYRLPYFRVFPLSPHIGLIRQNQPFVPAARWTPFSHWYVNYSPNPVINDIPLWSEIHRVSGIFTAPAKPRKQAVYRHAEVSGNFTTVKKPDTFVRFLNGIH
jgi:hypothetical protein